MPHPHSHPDPDFSAPDAPSPPVGADEGWGWYDTALIAVERADETGAATAYSIGAVDLYANAHTGDLGGAYLEIAAFRDLDQAAAYYQQLQGEIDQRRLLPFELVDFAGEQARDRAAVLGLPAPAWRPVTPAEYAAYEDVRSLDAPDLPPDDFAPADRLGSPAADFGPPPFVDPATGTAYWIGVFQPDADDPDSAVTGILSLGRDPDTGEVEAQLAPIVPGEWDTAYGAAEYLLGLVEKGGIERAFEAAEGLALASDQRALWGRERGIPLDPDAAQDLADDTRDQWEIDR